MNALEKLVNSRLRIAYVGPIAEPGKPARGGFEAASRRTIDLLREQGVAVAEFPYPVARGPVIAKSAAYAFRFAEIAAQLIQGRNHWNVLHMTPLMGQFMRAEHVLCLAAKKLRRPVLLDIRAGCLISDYHERSESYRRRLPEFIRLAEGVAIEGRIYAPFLGQWRDGEFLYFPNYVRWTSKHEKDERPDPEQAGEIRMVVLGRIVPEKGVEVAIEATEQLGKGGAPASLEIIGAGNRAYVDHLKARCRGLPVNFAGSLPPGEVMKRLATRHVFVFPTTHVGEGHSNALTEAMACGAAPVCSDNGFNRDVVGDVGAVLPLSAGAADYAGRIAEICSSGRSWRACSRRAVERVRANFTDARLMPELLCLYKKLAGV